MEIPVLNANNVDPDQTLRSVASALGLHCLPDQTPRSAVSALGLHCLQRSHYVETPDINGQTGSSLQ